jgi:hypothetical protein
MALKRVLGLLVLAIGGVIAGCGPPGPPPSAIDAPPASAADLLASIRARTHSFDTARLGFQLVWRDSLAGEEQSVGVGLSYAKPGRLRARGTAAAFFTAFELVVGSEWIWLDLPRDHVTIVGPRDDPAWARLPLGPDQLLEALFADPCSDGPCPPEMRLVTEADSFVVRSEAWSLWIDARTQLPGRAVHSGTEPYEMVWDEWAVRSGVPWPHRTEVRFPDRGVSVEVRLARVRVGPDLAADLFEFTPELDRDLLEPENAPWRWSWDAL